jgi:folate-binding protein YgfZ
MNPDWQNFLTQQGAQIADGATHDFGNATAELLAARDGTIVCDLSHFGLLKVSGEEAQTFLQNLLSSDVKAITPAHAQFSSFNSAKGRMLASFLIWQQGTDYFLHLPRSLTAAMQKKLSMYILRSKVKIADVSDEWVCMGLAGENANMLAAEIFAAAPSTDLDVLHQTNASLLRLSANRLMTVTTAQHAITLWPTLKNNATPAGSACWNWLTIRAGIPFILPATHEQFVPQMANLDLIGGVSFPKGCYPGQEIVARMQYLGKLKRRLYLAHIAGAAHAGDELYSAEMEGQSCGMVVNAAPAPEGGCDLLAVVQISSREAHDVRLGSLQGEVLQFLAMPYPIPKYQT